jgi:hypothetical protein
MFVSNASNHLIKQYRCVKNVEIKNSCHGRLQFIQNVIQEKPAIYPLSEARDGIKYYVARGPGPTKKARLSHV